jgi:hypothetical protein
LYQGADFLLPIQLKDAAGVGVPLVAGGLRAQIRPSFKSLSALDIAVDETDLPSGRFSLHVTPAQIASLRITVGTSRDIAYGFWDLEYTEVGITTRIMQGTVTISLEVTKPVP